ncbi:Non-specific serine/threonine protein kinase [Bertholletia excelsa]
MFYSLFLVWVCFRLSSAQQYYDRTLCSSGDNKPGTRYTCNASQNSCQTFFVYRANQQFQSISNISNLFGIDSGKLLSLNSLTSASDVLNPGREVLVPIICACTGQFFQASFSYFVHESTTFIEIACGVFEGLLKSVTLVEENENFSQEGSPRLGSILHVPLKCACPNNFTTKYLVTYPFIEGDKANLVGKKFGIPVEVILDANHLGADPTIFPNTTALVPLSGKPVINSSVADSDPPTPGFLPTNSVEQSTRATQPKKYFVAGSIIGCSLLLMALPACGLYVRALRKWKAHNIKLSAQRSSLTSCSTPRSSPTSGPMTRSSTNSCLSPDLLVGIKYSLSNYSIEDIRKATRYFSEDARINSCVYKGLIDNFEVMIKLMRFENTRLVIDAHSKINHKNIVKLLGVCYGENDFSQSYLVFEFPIRGCLRDCLSNPCSSPIWHRRTQLAFDVATGLHYLHYCMIPPCTHMSINSRNIFVTPDWRAKIAVLGSDNMSSPIGGWTAPEYQNNSFASEKVDIFAFGVVLLELISAKKDIDGKIFQESIRFLGGGAGEGGCFEQLKNFMDPCLKDNYPLAEALCLAVLAKACVEDDPLHRPSIEDIIKVIARML